MNITEGTKVTVSIRDLYKKYGTALTYHSILHTPIGLDSDTCDYFDLLGPGGGIVCMDGETCVVDHISDQEIRLFNDNGEQTEILRLTVAEFAEGATYVE